LLQKPSSGLISGGFRRLNFLVTGASWVTVERTIPAPRNRGTMKTPLRQHPDFLRLWAGQAVSQLGSSVSIVGLPLTAVVALGASPFQMGLLTGFGGLAILLFSPLAGAWADRFRRRRILILADVARGAALATIPLAAVLHRLSLGQLYFVAAANAAFSVFFNVTYQAYLPSLVGPDKVLEANSRLNSTESAAEIVGPGLTGLLVQLLTAPVAILLDAVSFLGSALSLLLIRSPEQRPDRSPHHKLGAEIAEGLHAAWHNPLLRTLMKRTGTLYFFMGFLSSLYFIYAVRQLGLSPGLVGILISIGGASSLLGAFAAERLVRTFGFGPTLVTCSVVGACSWLLVPLAHGPKAVCAAILGFSQLFDLTWTVTSIQELTLRQSLVPDRLQGRVNAAMHVLSHGILPIGALIAGGVASSLGVRATLFLGGAGCLLSTGWLVFSPIARLRELPEFVPRADTPNVLSVT
jgi:predicted MFS family arabinose efflux permease